MGGGDSASHVFDVRLKRENLPASVSQAYKKDANLANTWPRAANEQDKGSGMHADGSKGDHFKDVMLKDHRSEREDASSAAPPCMYIMLPSLQTAALHRPAGAGRLATKCQPTPARGSNTNVSLFAAASISPPNTTSWPLVKLAEQA